MSFTNNSCLPPNHCGDDAETFLSHPLMMSLGDFRPAENLDEDVLDFLVSSLGAYIIEHVIFRGSHYRETLDFVYGLNDGELYSVISAAHDDHYDFFVIHADYFHPRSIKHMHFQQVLLDCRTFLKNLKRYEGKQLAVQLQYLRSTIKEMKKSLVYTSRRGSGLTEDEGVVFPSLDELKLFYECERKTSYDSFEEGLEHRENCNMVYLCEHCGRYHQGHPPQVSSDGADPAKTLKRYKLTWRRYKSSGRLDKVNKKNQSN